MVDLINEKGSDFDISANRDLSSVTRLGDFLKFLASNFFNKVAQISGKLFGKFKVKTIVPTFLATFEEIGLIFILSSVHTGPKLKKTFLL